MKTFFAFGVLTIFVSVATASAEQRQLLGRVMLIDENGEARPATTPLEVRLAGHGSPAVTQENSGEFRIELPKSLQSGDVIKLQVNLKGYRIWTPIDGKTHIPRSLATDIIEIHLLRLGSKRFLSDKAIESLILGAASRSKKEMQENGKPRRLELGRYIDEWAQQRGLSVEEVKEEIERWVANAENNQTDRYRQALGAVARGNFDMAALHANAELQEKMLQYQDLKKSPLSLRESIARDLELVGDRYFDNAGFSRALETYEQALGYISNRESPELWASLMQSAGKTHVVLSEYAKENASRTHLRKAAAAYRQLLSKWSHGPDLRDWVIIQNELGKALFMLAKIEECSIGKKNAEEAVEAHKRALLAVNREQLSQYYWAVTNRNLGNALRELALLEGGGAGKIHLDDSLNSYQQALSVFTREQTPHDWASTQDGLGLTLSLLGASSKEMESKKEFFEKSRSAFYRALEVHTLQFMPHHWAITQGNLGKTLIEIGKLEEEEVGRENIENAIDIYHRILQIHRQGTWPVFWARAQYALGNALYALGNLTEGEDGRKNVEKAVHAYRQALLVHKREYFPRLWAETQFQLGHSLQALGGMMGSKNRIKNLNQSVEAYHNSLSVFSRIHTPHQWAACHASMAKSFLGLAALKRGKESMRYLRLADEANHQTKNILGHQD